VKAGVCKDCVDGGICKFNGMTMATLGVKPGYWRGSTTTDAIYECPRGANCKGGAANATWSNHTAPAGDALCTGHSKGPVCNVCTARHYRISSGADAGKCLSCSEVDNKSTAIVVIGLCLVVALLVTAGFKFAPISTKYPRLEAVLQWATGWYWNASEEVRSWWHDVLKELFLMAQCTTLFLRIETVEISAPKIEPVYEMHLLRAVTPRGGRADAGGGRAGAAGRSRRGRRPKFGAAQFRHRSTSPRPSPGSSPPWTS